MTPRGEGRRQEILLAARRVFEDRGYVETRVADIVAEAAVAQGTFYTYFDSKDAVFAELSRDVVEAMLASLRSERVSGTPTERITAGLRRFIHAFRPHARILGLVEQAGMHAPELAQVRLALREDFVERSARGIAQLQSAGIADASVDARLTAEVLGSMVDQTCYLWLSLGKDFAEDAVVATLASVWTRAIGIHTDTGVSSG